MGYKEEFEDFLDKMQGLLDNAKKQGHINVRVEDEDERIRKELLEHCKNQAKPYTQTGNKCLQIQSWIEWLKKQGTPAKLSEEEQNRFAKVVLSNCALSFIYYLDAHKYEGKMCVSNGECEDIENAFHNAMWDRLHRYYCKYIKKQGEHKFIIGDIISNGKVEYRVDNIVKNAIGQDCYFLVNIESEKNGTRYCKLHDSEGKTHNSGEITWLCEQVDAKFKKKILDFNAADWYVSKVDGKIYNAKFMESSEKQGEQVEINPSEFDLRLNRLLKQFESLPKEELTNSLSFYLNVVQNDGTYVEEKQGEQKPANKVEPKFKVGDWIVSSVLGTAHIIGVNDSNKYQLEYIDGRQEFSSIDYVNYAYDKWTIQDAKDGDVLFMDNGSANCIFIYKSFNNGIINKYGSYNNFGFEGEHYLVLNDGYAIPATKEQRDTLFAKMKEAGYEWNADKKELKKIEQKPTNENPTDVGHEYYSELLNNDDSDTIDEYAYQCAYCMSHDWMKETATWEDVQKAVKLGAEWQKQNPAECSEEDEDAIEMAIIALEDMYDEDAPNTTYGGYNLPFNKAAERLKSLKDRVQPKQEWSEEDEHRAEDTIYFLDTAKKHYASTVELDACIDWLESLKQRIG